MLKHISISKVYITFWIAAITFEVAPWLPEWQPGFTKMAIVNLLHLAALFTAFHFTARSIALKLPLVQKKLPFYRTWQSWVLFIMPFIYAVAGWNIDKYLLNLDHDRNFAIYALRNIKFASPYMLMPVLCGGLWTYKDEINNLLRKVILIEQEKNLLEKHNAELAGFNSKYGLLNNPDVKIINLHIVQKNSL